MKYFLMNEILLYRYFCHEFVLDVLEVFKKVLWTFWNIS